MSCFTMITADKDDPRFDIFYLKGKHARYFLGIFFDLLPSYMSLGFEIRNLHDARGQNEEYSKLYVFKINDDAERDKVTHGPFKWGQNQALFLEIQTLKLLQEKINADIHGFETKVVATENSPVFIWEKGDYTFMVNFNENEVLNLPAPYEISAYEMFYSSRPYAAEHQCIILKKRAI
jgi:hypothetical protein